MAARQQGNIPPYCAVGTADKQTVGPHPCRKVIQRWQDVAIDQVQRVPWPRVCGFSQQEFANSSDFCIARPRDWVWRRSSVGHQVIGGTRTINSGARFLFMVPPEVFLVVAPLFVVAMIDRSRW